MVPNSRPPERPSARRLRRVAEHLLCPAPTAGEGLTAYTRSADFPPADVGRDKAKATAWYTDSFGATPMKGPDPSLTDREKHIYQLSAEDYVRERRSGALSCEEVARALVKRAMYYRYMNVWIYTNYILFDRFVEKARELDAKAAKEGVESIAPFYGLPIPMKGTAAVVDFPSGAGSGVLSGYTPVKDSELTTMIKNKNGLIFGTTNVPEFAAGGVTANPASGQTRNPYDHKLTVGGSSGGSAAAVASYMCAIAVTEDTGGSTRLPASSTQNFGFDPSRNHYPNGGNPGITYTNDQLGLNARSLGDVLLFDKALFADVPAVSQAHVAAEARVGALPAAAIKIGTPIQPFVDCPSPPGLRGASITGFTVNADVRAKYEGAKQALAKAGFTLVQEEWPSRHFDYLGREENVMLEAMFTRRLVNGKPLGPDFAASFAGQLGQWVWEYLDAPVSVKEVMEDMGEAGAAVQPGAALRGGLKASADESQFRYAMGPKIQVDLEAYNSYFEATGADLIMIPATRAATPDLAALAGGTVPLKRLDGTPTTGSVIDYFGVHLPAMKHLHIPRMVVPTGLSEDGRPTAVQFWGRAVPYEKMFDDAFSAQRDADFLQLVKRAVEGVHADPSLRRADAKAFLGF